MFWRVGNGNHQKAPSRNRCHRVSGFSTAAVLTLVSRPSRDSESLRTCRKADLSDTVTRWSRQCHSDLPRTLPELSDTITTLSRTPVLSMRTVLTSRLTLSLAARYTVSVRTVSMGTYLTVLQPVRHKTKAIKAVIAFTIHLSFYPNKKCGKPFALWVAALC